jgi:Tol biopolymer transport system component
MLNAGARLGPYEIVAPLGSGGMGEVWRARDARLGRDVAIKVLSARLAGDPGRMAAFQREAKALAALNHPNIAAIYGLEDSGGHPALVMELVEGPTLAARLRMGPLPLEEALGVARQIADAIESAHQSGIIHRDLKPANVKLRPDGTVKVLDFGLAKMRDAATGEFHDTGPLDDSPSGEESPAAGAHNTVFLASGAEGPVVAGTAAYMSPEQARGKRVDARTDIWSFGVLLFEILTGRRPFVGGSTPATIELVLNATPDWRLLPAAVPTRVRNLLRRCLTREPRQRLQAIGDARVVLEEVLLGREDTEAVDLRASGEQALVAPRGGVRRLVPWIAAAAAGAALVAGWGLGWFERSAPARPMRFTIALPPGERLVGAPPAFSPDGRSVAFLSAPIGRGTTLLRLQALDAFESVVVPEPQEVVAVFWSPDSRWLGYMVPGAIRKREIATGATETVCRCADLGRGGTWGRDGTILFAPNPNSGIYRIPASGGEAEAVTDLGAAAHGVDISHRFPTFLPDGRHFVFTVWSNSAEVRRQEGGLFLGSLAGGPLRRLSAEASSTAFLPPRYLLAQREGKLVALPFDLGRLELAGDPLAVADRVAFAGTTGALLASASDQGDILFATQWRAELSSLRWYGRDGTPGEEVERRIEANGEDLRLSADGTRLALTHSPAATGVLDIWISDLGRATTSRLTHSVNDSFWPRWSPDGARVVFTNRDSGEEDLYVQTADASGPAERVYSSEEQDTRASDWAEGGRTLFFDATDKKGGARWQVWVVDLPTGAARSLLSDPAAHQRSAVLSPDGRWLAYVGDESGREEVYVRPYPGLDRKWQLSREGGTAPRWRRDAGEIVFRAGDGSLWAVAFNSASADPRPGIPQRLFAAPDPVSGFDATADHQRFLLAVVPPREMVRAEPLRVLLDWSPGS